MYQQQKSGWIKHWDFTVIDVICMELTYFLVVLFYNPGQISLVIDYQELGLLLAVFMVLVGLVLKPYSGILRRNMIQEFISVLGFVSVVMTCELAFLFFMKTSSEVSRGVMFFTWILCSFSLLVCRLLHKKTLRYHMAHAVEKRSIVLLVSQENVAHVLHELTQGEFLPFKITAVFFFGETPQPELVKDINIQLFYGRADATAFLEKNVVDELFVRLPNGKKMPEDFMGICRDAGIAVHTGLARKSELFGTQSLETIGNYYVLTSSIHVISPVEAAAKRLMDICGALAGLMIAAFVTLFVGPAIYIASPGPIFFSQTRIGRNGRQFKFYKFRSMYLDAEARKAELMKENKMSGLMFKMDDDPRIIKGVGHFIRKTSLDEFPQFWNVLCGDMSLVGTRPPTQGEYEQYELNHKSRLAFKPGITGLWQVSGRSDIVDFDEVIRLDTQYIETWSILEDIRILVKTVLIVLGQKGSE